MRMYIRLPFNLFVFLVVTVTLGVWMGVVFSASPGDGHLKRHGAAMV